MEEATIPTTGLHGADLTFKGKFAGYRGGEELNLILLAIFGLSVADLVPGILEHAKYRRYEECYTYRNLIEVYLKGFTANNRESVHISIKGSAFDSRLVNEAELKRLFTQGRFTVSRLDLYSDDDGKILDFQSLLDSVSMFHFVSRVKPIIYQGNCISEPRSIVFGKGDSLIIYERGKYHPETHVSLSYIRVERKLSGKYANAVYTLICKGDLSLGEVTSSLILSTVEFKNSNGKNKIMARRKTDPAWKSFLAGAEKIRLQVTPPTPNIALQLAGIDRANRNNFITHGIPVMVATFIKSLEENQEIGIDEDTTWAMKTLNNYIANHFQYGIDEQLIWYHDTLGPYGNFEEESLLY